MAKDDSNVTSDGLGNEARLAASYLIDILELADDEETVGRELTIVDRDQTVTVYAAEFDSSVGPAAFLIYLYRLDQLDNEGRRGHERFAEDLATLETAARLDTPGPRAISHLHTEANGLILATSPAVFRALRGVPEAGPEASPRPVDPASLRAIREEQALRLLRLLTSANRAAEAWLDAVEDAPAADPIPEETELSLFLNDEQSIKSLLRALRRLLDTTGPVRS